MLCCLAGRKGTPCGGFFSLPYSPLFSRDLNFVNIFSAYFAIVEKNRVCREFNFTKLTIK